MSLEQESTVWAAAMRVTEHRKRRIARILHRIIAAVALCAVAMPSMAVDLLQTPPQLWVSAAALSLTLVTAANRPKN